MRGWNFLRAVLILCALTQHSALSNERKHEPGSSGKRAEANVHPKEPIRNAAAHFLKEIQGDPSNPSNYRQLFQALFLDDRREELAHWFFEYLSRFPTQAKNADFHFNLAMTLYGLQRREESLHHFIEAIASPPRAGEYMMHAGSDYLLRSFHHIAMLLEETGRPSEAARAILTTFRLKNGELKYGSYLVSAFLTANKVAEAVSIHNFLNGEELGAQPSVLKGLEAYKAAKSSKPLALNPSHGILFHFLQKYGSLYATQPSGPLNPSAREEVKRLIYHRQFPEDCQTAKVLVYSLKDAYAGFGAEVHGIVLALSLAWSLDRVLVMPRRDGWWYTEQALCPQRGMDCYFERLSACHVEDTREENRMAFSYPLALRRRGFVPEELRGLGLVEWRSALVAYLLRPNEVLRSRISTLKKAVGWQDSKKTVALHIRRGDRMVSRRIVRVEEYLEALKHTLKQTKAKRVLLCTEDFEVSQAIRSAFTTKDFKGVELLMDPQEARNSVENSRLLEVSHSLSMQEYALTAIANLALMSDCQYFVGAFHSHFGRLAFEWGHGKGSLLAPPLVLDLLWSSL